MEIEKLIHRNYINKECQMLCITPTLKFNLHTGG
eukprot:UN08025